MPCSSMIGASSSVHRWNTLLQLTSCHWPSTLIIGPAVGVFVQCPQGGALRADVAATPGVVEVVPDARDPAVPDVNLRAAHHLAQRTGLEVAPVLADARQGRGVVGGHRLPPWSPACCDTL